MLVVEWKLLTSLLDPAECSSLIAYEQWTAPGLDDTSWLL